MEARKIGGGEYVGRIHPCDGLIRDQLAKNHLQAERVQHVNNGGVQHEVDRPDGILRLASGKASKTAEAQHRRGDGAPTGLQRRPEQSSSIHTASEKPEGVSFSNPASHGNSPRRGASPSQDADYPHLTGSLLVPQKLRNSLRNRQFQDAWMRCVVVDRDVCRSRVHRRLFSNNSATVVVLFRKDRIRTFQHKPQTAAFGDPA